LNLNIKVDLDLLFDHKVILLLEVLQFLINRTENLKHPALKTGWGL